MSWLDKDPKAEIEAEDAKETKPPTNLEEFLEAEGLVGL